MRFRDRRHAGRELAERLLQSPGLRRSADPIVLALPRGGVPVAVEVARALGAPLDVLVVHKIGAPGQPEAGIGAVVGDDPPVFDRRVLKILGITADRPAGDLARERAELHRREDLYRQGRPPPRLAGRTVVLVDDGLATGVTARAALRRVRGERPARLILAVPVCDARSAGELRDDVDELVCLSAHRYLHAIGPWYEDFRQVPDHEVTDALRSLHAVDRAARQQA
ncbi:phosphoribosyltransferase [Kitasatospora sp. NPDC127111]|uniref:phosphoribosyltransferase n=1 Tax=Kitasatospora sp. NPDC127111 TaxID=3345363 RepID=UPI003641E140